MGVAERFFGKGHEAVVKSGTIWRSPQSEPFVQLQTFVSYKDRQPSRCRWD